MGLPRGPRRGRQEGNFLATPLVTAPLTTASVVISGLPPSPGLGGTRSRIVFNTARHLYGTRKSLRSRFGASASRGHDARRRLIRWGHELGAGGVHNVPECRCAAGLGAADDGRRIKSPETCRKDACRASRKATPCPAVALEAEIRPKFGELLPARAICLRMVANSSQYLTHFGPTWPTRASIRSSYTKAWPHLTVKIGHHRPKATKV